MDKVGRVLLLFWQLYCGNRISKETFCFEMDIDRRTFDRDIAAVRDFLAESYSGREVIFEPKGKFYYMTGAGKRMMTEVELTAIANILLGSRALRKDEMSGLIETLKQVTEYIHSDTERELTHWTGEYDGSYHYSAVLKMQWDLLQCIERRLLIRMQYMVQDGKGEELEVIPLRMYFGEYHFQLRAIQVGKNAEEKVFEVDRIESFQIVRGLNHAEQKLYFKIDS